MADDDDGAFDLDGPPPAPAAARPPRRRGRPRWWPVAAALLVLLLAVGASALLREPAPEPPPTAAQLLRVLTTAADEDDALAEAGVELPAVLAGSTRGVAVTADARYWTGLDAEGRVCLLVLVDRVVPGYGASCVDPADFAVAGAAMRTSVGGVVSDAVLVPDGFDTAALEADGLVRAGANLLVRPSGP